MALQDAEQSGDVLVDVVDDFILGRIAAAQEYAAHANKRLGIELVRHGLDARDDAFGQNAFAAQIGCDWINW